MRLLASTMIATLALVACGGAPPAEAPLPEEAAPASASASEPAGGSEASKPEADEANAFALKDSDSAEGAHGATESKIKPTKTEAALKFIVVDKDKGPIEGVVISLSAAGKTYYTEETDSTGYAEVLVPVGQKYG